MVFRRTGDERDQVVEGQEDGLNIVSGDDDDDEGEVYDSPFNTGESCWVCQKETGRVGLDATCHGNYGGEDGLTLLGYNCLEQALKDAYEKTEGIGVIIEPFGENMYHLYYRLDEMPAYGFPREDIEAVSWQMLALGDACSRCGQQSHFAWLTKDFVDPELPEDEEVPVFRNMDKDYERLCRSCAASALAAAYTALKLPLVTAELPRAAMGIMMPSGA